MSREHKARGRLVSLKRPALMVGIARVQAQETQRGWEEGLRAVQTHSHQEVQKCTDAKHDLSLFALGRQYLKFSRAFNNKCRQ
jgi:hypothetical protein